MPKPDRYSHRSHRRRGEVPFLVWVQEVAFLLDSEVPADGDSPAPLQAAVAASLNSNFGALSRLYQFDELSPAEVVEGIEAAVAFADAAPEPEATEVPADLQEARDNAEAVEAAESDAADAVRDRDTSPTPVAEEGLLESQVRTEEVRTEVREETVPADASEDTAEAVEAAREDDDPAGPFDADDSPNETEGRLESEDEEV